MKILSSFLVTLTLALPALARTWTSTDGRTIEASLVSNSEDSVVLRLDASGANVTVKKSLLSATDLAFIEKTTVSDKDIILIIARYPPFTAEGESYRQLNDKYAGFVKIMTPSAALNVCQLMRKKLTDDIKYWKAESERPIPPFPLLDLRSNSTQQKAHEEMKKKVRQQKQQDKDAYKWVSETLPAWIAEVEKTASQQ